MTAPDDARSPSLDAVRALERQLAERRTEHSAAEAELADAREEADRLREAARARGAAAADDRRRLRLEEVEREAARVRAEAERQAAALSAAMRARLPETVVALASIVLPLVEER